MDVLTGGAPIQDPTPIVNANVQQDAWAQMVMSDAERVDIDMIQKDADNEEVSVVDTSLVKVEILVD